MKFQHVFAIFTAFGAGFLVWNASGMKVAHASGNPPEATIEYLERSYDGDGRESGFTLHTLSLRQDGSFRDYVRKWWKAARDSNPLRMEYVERVHMYDLSTRRAVHMYPALGFKSTLVLQDQEATRLLTRGSAPCEGVADGTVAGEPVVRRTWNQEQSPGGGRISITERSAPALGCFPLVRWTEDTDASGKLLARQVREAISVRRGPPAAGDFAVPAGFVEKPPSEIMLADATRRGRPCSDCVRGTAARADRRYAERRAPEARP